MVILRLGRGIQILSKCHTPPRHCESATGGRGNLSNQTKTDEINVCCIKYRNTNDQNMFSTVIAGLAQLTNQTFFVFNDISDNNGQNGINEINDFFNFAIRIWNSSIIRR